MNHISEDAILEYALEVCDETARAAVSDHLAQCSACRERLAATMADLEIIRGLRPRRAPVKLPRRFARRRIFYRTARAAALIVLGIGIGYMGSSRVHQGAACVSPAYIATAPPADPIRAFAASDATEVPDYYYQTIPRQRR